MLVEERLRGPSPATVIVIVQGAHVLARADTSQAPFDRVIDGALVLLRGLESRG